jgi:hypothetical protein
MPKQHFQLRFPLQDIQHWASKYPAEDDAKVLEYGHAARERGELTRTEFLEMCRWKTPRSQPLCKENTPDTITEATRFALSTRNEGLRIEVLTLLRGVGWPMASVLLHLCHCQPYPILDFRALWSLESEVPASYTFEFWRSYTDFTRELAEKADCSMRTLDRALWQYSREHQST